MVAVAIAVMMSPALPMRRLIGITVIMAFQRGFQALHAARLGGMGCDAHGEREQKRKAEKDVQQTRHARLVAPFRPLVPLPSGKNVPRPEQEDRRNASPAQQGTRGTRF